MLEVTCAIIRNADQKVLVTQRSATMKLPLKIEFPGGKVEPGESTTSCLIREIKEELNVDIKPVFELPCNIHHYPDFTIKLIPFICEVIGGTIELKEHAAYMWLLPKELESLDWAEADIPIMKHYLLRTNTELFTANEPK